MFKIIAPENFRLAINIIAFQIAWATAVLLGDIYALAVTCIYLIIHQVFLLKGSREWILIVVIVLLGTLVDTLFTAMGILDFGKTLIVIPLWLICLWVMFATTLCHSLRWFKNNLLLAAGFAAVAGPFSYFAGARLNDVELGQPLWCSLLILSLWWACVFPVTLKLTRWVENEN